jgi:hypothetical protein
MNTLVRAVPHGAEIVGQTLRNNAQMTYGEYQEAAHAQVLELAEIDGDRGTICGYPRDAYFYLGAIGEYAETIGPDPLHPAYDRKATLMAPKVPRHDENVYAKDLHGKEFGDLHWFAANGLKGYEPPANVPAVLDTMTLRQIDHYSIDSRRQIRHLGRVCGQLYKTAAGRYFEAAEAALQHTHPDEATRQRLFNAAADLLVATSAVLQTRLHVGLDVVLSGNLRKVEGRIGRGNVFDPNGGDTR